MMQSENNNDAVCLAIVIATADRSRLVLDCIASFRNQVPLDVQLVVVDAGKEDPVDELATQALWPNSQVIRSEVRNASVQRNMGVEAAMTEVMANTADDRPQTIDVLGGKDTAGYEKKTESGDQRAEGVGQRTEGQKPEIGDQRSEDGGLGAGSEDGGQRTDDQGLRTKDQGPISKHHTQESSDSSLQSSPDDIVIFLDDDTLVNPGWWPQILKPFSDPKVAIVQGGIHNSRQPHLRIDRGGYVKWNGFTEACIERGADAPRELDWPMTTNMAVRKSVYEAVGGLDPIFVVYDEDVDFGLRIRKAGWLIVHEPAASVYHYGHRMWRPPATKQNAFRKGRNRSIMLVKNYGLFGRVWIYVLISPFSLIWRALVNSSRTVWRFFGHAFAEITGVFAGVYVGSKSGTWSRTGKAESQNGACAEITNNDSVGKPIPASTETADNTTRTVE